MISSLTDLMAGLPFELVLYQSLGKCLNVSVIAFQIVTSVELFSEFTKKTSASGFS
jgi:hypothetical protein